MEFKPMAIAMLLLFGACFNRLSAQDSTSAYNRITSFPDKFFNSINRKSSGIQDKLSRQTTRYLQKLARQEKKLQRQLAKKDSAAAARLFNGTDSQYLALQNHLNQTGKTVPLQGVVANAQHRYSGHLDTIVTALQFLQQNKLPGQPAVLQEKLQGSLSQLADMQNKLDQTAAVQQFLKQRQQYLQEQLGKYGMGSELRQYKETVYYYRAQMDEYKKTWEDPSAMEKKALGLLSGTNVFKRFFNRHSELAGLFRLPGADNIDGPAIASIAGLQPREMMQQRLGSGPNMQQALQQGAASVQAESNPVKDKLSGLLGKGGGDAGMPD
ncbi:MAG TPA: hypothetical protein VLD19_07895, partial [Chitinophagaceae bacterium]|nr:hypothetical protein [Chitinophagaceae bacterium]